MNLTEFFRAAEHLTNSTRSLQDAVEHLLAQAEDQLIRRDRQITGGPPSQDLAALDMRNIGVYLQEVMFAYDLVMKAMDMAPCFQLYFRLVDAPRHVREEMRRLLNGTGYSWEQPG
jgi:hypothetical protein